jgi:hypothetical protein
MDLPVEEVLLAAPGAAAVTAFSVVFRARLGRMLGRLRRR